MFWISNDATLKIREMKNIKNAYNKFTGLKLKIHSLFDIVKNVATKNFSVNMYKINLHRLKTLAVAIRNKPKVTTSYFAFFS